MAGELVLDRLPLHDVLVLGQVAEDVEVAQPVELGVQLAAAGGVVAAETAGFGADDVEDVRTDLLVGLEVVQPFDELGLERLGLRDRLAAALRVAPRGAEVAANAGAGAAGAVHPRTAALAVEELAEQVILGGTPGLQDASAPGADLLDTLEELFVDERLVQAADRAVLATQAADVAAVGGVDEHLAHGVLAERVILCRAGAAGVEPLGERAVGLLPGRVALEQLADEIGPLRIGDGESGVPVADVAPRERADEVPLPRLLAQAGAGPERERDGVVLVEHLVDRLGEEEGRVGRVVADRLGDRDDADAEAVAEQGLVAARLGLVPGEAGGVVDEHDVEALLGCVGHQALELGPAVGLLPAAVEVAVVVDELELVLVGEATDRLPLRIG